MVLSLKKKEKKGKKQQLAINHPSQPPHATPARKWYCVGFKYTVERQVWLSYGVAQAVQKEVDATLVLTRNEHPSSAFLNKKILFQLKNTKMPFMSLKFIKTNLPKRTKISLDVCLVFFF